MTAIVFVLMGGGGCQLNPKPSVFRNGPILRRGKTNPHKNRYSSGTLFVSGNFLFIYACQNFWPTGISLSSRTSIQIPSTIPLLLINIILPLIHQGCMIEVMLQVSRLKRMDVSGHVYSCPENVAETGASLLQTSITGIYSKRRVGKGLVAPARS
jgi:hypothetical protein